MAYLNMSQHLWVPQALAGCATPRGSKEPGYPGVNGFDLGHPVVGGLDPWLGARIRTWISKVDHL